MTPIASSSPAPSAPWYHKAVTLLGTGVAGTASRLLWGTQKVPVHPKGTTLFDWLNPRSFFADDLTMGAAGYHALAGHFKLRLAMDWTQRGLQLGVGYLHRALGRMTPTEDSKRRELYKELEEGAFKQAKSGFFKEAAINVFGCTAAVAATASHLFTFFSPSACTHYLSQLEWRPWRATLMEEAPATVVAGAIFRSGLCSAHALGSGFIATRNYCSKGPKTSASAITQPLFQSLSSAFMGLGYYVQGLHLLAVGSGESVPRNSWPAQLFRGAALLWAGRHLYQLVQPFVTIYRLDREVEKLDGAIKKAHRKHDKVEVELKDLIGWSQLKGLPPDLKARIDEEYAKANELAMECTQALHSAEQGKEEIAKVRESIKASARVDIPLQLSMIYFILLPFFLSLWESADYASLLCEGEGL